MIKLENNIINRENYGKIKLNGGILNDEEGLGKTYCLI